MDRPRAHRWIAATAALMMIAALAHADAAADRATVAALDTEYQAAVKRNDAATMDRILHDDFVLVLGTGSAFTKKDLLEDARSQNTIYEHQEEDPGTQTVRLYGDSTAVVTARLYLAYAPKGGGEKQEYRLWFSDTYVRTPAGWKYVFGQAAQPLAPKPKPAG